MYADDDDDDDDEEAHGNFTPVPPNHSANRIQNVCAI